jgi:arginyl-tRNA synthetase
MTAEQFIQEKAAQAIKALWGADVEASSLQVGVTRKEFEGDYTLVTFPLLKITHTSPDACGNAIGEWLTANVPEISAYNSVKGFLNLLFSQLYWNEVLRDIAQAKEFGRLPLTGKRIMVEFSSPNTNKPLHLGHIRNNLLGDSVSRILKACGNEVIKSTIVNDRGVHICKSMYAWEKCFNGATPQSTGKKGDHLVGDCYVAYAKMEKEHPEIIDEVHKMLVKWEQNDPHVRELWSMMNGWVYAGFDETYKALGITFDQVDHESETYLLGKELVQKGLDMGVFTRDPDGSVWCDLTADGLDRKLVLRGDGTSVYITQDLGTAERRFAKYNLDSHVYVVGNEQDYHFQVLKLILGKLGFDWASRIYHLSYGMVELPEGKMKSREGTVVDADDLIQSMYEEARRTSEESGKLADMSPEEKDRLFHIIGLGALKYFIIKVDPKKTMLFNPSESIDFNGNTGPFIQYTHARICSILRKADADMGPGDIGQDVQASAKEIRLVKLLSQYPSKVAESGASLSPAVIANYAYELAKEFNQYYHETPILKEENPALLRYRLVLIGIIASTLRSAMGLLGIELPERM